MAEQLSAGARTTVTMVVLALLLAVGAVWGWSAVTEPFPGKTEPEVCTMVDIAEGERVFPEQVTVSVLNAGERSGLAGDVMGKLANQGFDQGELGNAPDDADIARAQIWSDEPDNPAVRLVRSRLGKKVPVLARSSAFPGVVVVVGDKFDKLRKGRQSVAAAAPARVCGPVVE
ncbi:LytR C-terminal domain-containing protein [Nocardioides ferulae]|uniref:LytR C-terminal domain-containing protein n=1 Tax=Nocardioides ferulae TaxID=2340821 RepID=UPI000EAC333C|nr:LytR C-terminal domain-containing protein [Nocardioides ferulae]